MRFLITFLAAGALGAAAVVAAPGQRPDRGPDRAEAAYAKLLAGKTPGKEEACIDTRFTKPQLSAHGTRLLYRVSDRLVYVSETGGGCENVARGDAMVTRQFQTRLCRGDIAQTVDLPTRMPTGSCALGGFVPYRSK
ncbi:MAG: hypothetical protein DI544_09010 [Sphingomonas taxi]|uniref:Uncharacterized protein n=1 Tax=Sphingomonas taxi TaxID=1549858 RepID=A0A2W5PCA2_9SPHN|nr:MAG: hypothetical protein DI544_09010 [Sphingomonas taxi]